MAEANKIIVVESLQFKDGKTSEAVKLLAKIGVTKNTLIVVEDKSDDIMRATANIQKVQVVQANYVNTYDVMNADCIVMTAQALKDVTVWLAPKAKAAPKKAEA
jgi:large subunit ribosomal protein L4